MYLSHFVSVLEGRSV